MRKTAKEVHPKLSMPSFKTKPPHLDLIGHRSRLDLGIRHRRKDRYQQHQPCKRGHTCRNAGSSGHTQFPVAESSKASHGTTAALEILAQVKEC